MPDTLREPPPLMPPLRSFLLDGVLQFTSQACRLRGVLRIALIGSLTTPKLTPRPMAKRAMASVQRYPKRSFRTSWRPWTTQDLYLGTNQG
ncbi:MAG: hypothetical protein EOP02_28015 [Proteobacteria bacterium]|nr:MAG: hypothetical protein EOP02_28015 [Pseudomonadota bacterium]